MSPLSQPLSAERALTVNESKHAAWITWVGVGSSKDGGPTAAVSPCDIEGLVCDHKDRGATKDGHRGENIKSVAN